ncbi:hypothetical protein L6164_010455 [Bauhinia variegata]|uniref:Uncharacterized protein n=1 Tax=Bauhinia variegata TaxID=167791 RepID=A0ACB9PNA9_BAUVA|nr:hypothetical protein L6164_010455 [Bauhinia variegata]
MASKRRSDNNGNDRNLEIPVQHSKRRNGDSEQIAIRAIEILRVVLPIWDVASSMEDLFRRVVGQELDRQLFTSPNVHQIGASVGKTPELRFTNRVASTIFYKIQDQIWGKITLSLCTRSGKFRLGARVAESPPNEENIIREGISEPFKVKDSREYKKHYTIKDLLRLYITNPSSLQEKFGKILKKKWETIIKHANSSVIDEYGYKLYIYPTDQQAELMRLLFNPINMHDMVERVKQHACKNLKDLISLDEATTINLLAQLGASPNQSLLQIIFTSGFPTAHQGQPENLAASSAHLCELVHNPMPQSSYARADQFPFHLTCIDDWTFTLDGSQFPVAPPQYSSATHLPHSSTTLM